jgi:hypothetical protein
LFLIALDGLSVLPEFLFNPLQTFLKRFILSERLEARTEHK